MTERSTRRERLLITAGTAGALAAVTLGSWLMVSGTIDTSSLTGASGVPEGDCPSGIQQPVVAERVEVSVYNTTNEPGLAGDVAADLEERSFRVDEVDNDYLADTDFEGIIRVGERGLRQAYTLQQHLPSTLVDIDGRDDFSVDLVLGADYDGLEDPHEVEIAPGRISCSDTQ